MNEEKPGASRPCHNKMRINSVFWSFIVSVSMISLAFADQAITLDPATGGKRFDGIGAVSGGGGTSVLLKDYAEPYRGQILDLLFKPKFGASISALYVEVGGDGNSTQGSELSHMHSRDDLNLNRGYEWWLMSEAKKRNSAITLDACAWSCPGWIGDGNFYSQDMCDYYVKWIQGLKSTHDMTLDAIGIRNERGVNENFAKMFRRTLDAANLQTVPIHAFDNWRPNKWDWTANLYTDPELRNAVSILGNHTFVDISEHNGPVSAGAVRVSEEMHKPIWDTEEHVYLDGYDGELALVYSFADNFIKSGATKIVDWYLVDSMYKGESYKTQPAAFVADQPWSGFYAPREMTWGYAHYGQFTQAGWQYMNGACRELEGGGSCIAMRSPDAGGASDYSIIIETRGAMHAQRVNFAIAGSGLREGTLCVWTSNRDKQFFRMGDIKPVDGKFSILLEPKTIYSISTTTGQQKGMFADVPKSAPFPANYRETFDEYADAAAWGYLPHYTADLSGAFELVNRPDGKGGCLRQVAATRAQAWGGEWAPCTVFGDAAWTDYEVSCDVLLDPDSRAGVIGRMDNEKQAGVNHQPRCLYLQLADDGTCTLFATACTIADRRPKVLATAKINAAGQWHNLKLRMAGTAITGLVDGIEVLHATDDSVKHGLAGLCTGPGTTSNPTTAPTYTKQSTADFDNVAVNPIGITPPPDTDFGPNRRPMYPAK